MIDVREISDEELKKEYVRRVEIKDAEASIVYCESQIKEYEEVIARTRERIRVLKD